MPHDLNPEWEHVDDWLDLPPADDGEADAKRWLNEFRKPAAERDNTWLNARLLICTYEGREWRVTGASRLGGVWLTKDMTRYSGYDKRVDVLACSDWLMVEGGTECNS